MFTFVKPIERYRVAPLCPCGRNNRDGKFAPVVIDGKPEADNGYCFSCDKTFKQGYSANNAEKQAVIHIQPAIKLVDQNEVIATLKGYNNNNFAVALKRALPEKADFLLKYFSVGTCRKGGTLFWYRDCNNNYRKLKRVYYKPNGSRYQPEDDRYKSICSPLHYTNSNGFEYCIYGEFQLSLYPENAPVFIVESEKTVIVCYAHYPKYLWLATGGINGLTFSQAKVLKGRKVIILPDMHKTARTVAIKTKQLLESHNCKVTICDLDPTLQSGQDIADLLLEGYLKP